MAGGISSVLNGGKFGHGFASAGLTQAFSGMIDSIGGRYGNVTSSEYFSTINRAKRIVASAIVGGLASKLTGGKFVNGAITGAFSRAYNDEAHFEQKEESFWDSIWMPGDKLPQGLVDFAAGFGDVVSFGMTDKVRDWMNTTDAVNSDSGFYTAGQVTGIAHSMVLGGGMGWRGAMGWRAANGPKKGFEFSHWIPNRMGGPRSKWNGNFVTKEFHALTDPYRYRFMPRTWKRFNPPKNRLYQQWGRIPLVYKGAAYGLGFSAGSMYWNNNQDGRYIRDNKKVF